MKDLFKTLLLCYLIVAGVVLPFTSFRTDCHHIYTPVHEKEVKVKQWRNNTMLPMIIPDTIITGKHEGQQLVCVKCFHLTKQILDYGNANNENKTGALTSMWPDLRRITDSLLKLNPPNTGLVDDRTHKLIMK